MKKRELQEIKTKSVEELNKTLGDLEKKKIEVQVAIASGKESDFKALKKIRREIAQILTIRGIIERSEEKVKEKTE